MVKTAGSGSYSICTAATASRSLVLVRMRKQHNRLVAMVHLAVGQARLIGHNELNVILAGNILRGDNANSLQSMRRSKANLSNEPRGMCCAPWLRATCRAM